MKIKQDFVTNSSSTSYIFSCNEDILSKLKEIIKRIHNTYVVSEFNFHYYKSRKEINDATQGKPLDWVQEATGPEFNVYTQYEYNSLIKALKIGDIACFIKMNRNFNFNENINNLDINIIEY